MASEHEPADKPLWRQSLNADREHNTGIGGWLLLVAVGLVVAPFQLLYSAVTDLLPAWKQAWVEWEEYESPMRIAGYLGFETAIHLLAIVLCAVTIYLFFGKKRLFRKFVFVWLAIQLLSPFARLLVVNFALGPEQLEALGINGVETYLFAIVRCSAWAFYFVYSERVKNTFVK